MDELLKSLIDEAVCKALTAFLSEKQTCKCGGCGNCETEKPEPDKLLTVPEACKELRISRCTLNRWEKNGYLIPVRIGGSLRYRGIDIKKVKGA